MASETRGTVLLALLVNVAVALAKGVGGLLSGSAALLSEAAHSVADTLNEVFLLLSLTKAERPADRTHPFGYGKERPEPGRPRPACAGTGPPVSCP